MPQHQNLRLLREMLPFAKLAGVDINKKAIKHAKEYFQSVNDNNVSLIVNKGDQLTEFEDGSFDVVFSQAVMIHHPPKSFDKVVAKMLKLSSNVVIFNEYHLDGAEEGLFDSGRWVYDYFKVVQKHHPDAKVTMQQSDFKGGSWDKYGKLVTVILR